MSAPLISVIIPVRNGAKVIDACLHSIINQSLFYKSEIIIIDSGSTDETINILSKYPVRLYRIASEKFNHGLTRDYGVRLAKGTFIMLTVQDAILENDRIFETALKHFEDINVGAVGGRQVVPHLKKANPHHWYRPVNKAKIEYFQFNNSKNFSDLTPKQKRWVCSLDNVIAFYRKKALLEIPFNETDFGEDLKWAINAYNKQFAIIFDPNLIAWHYHSQNYSYTYRLTIILTYIDWVNFKLLSCKNFQIIDIIKIIYRNIKYKAHPKWIIRNIIYNIAAFKACKEMNDAIKNSEEKARNLFESYTKIIPQGKQ